VFRNVMAPPLILFFVLAALLVVASFMVVFQRNVVHSALSLVGALFLIALFFIMLHAPLVGVLQILIYAGAIMVLFLFVIMLLSPVALEQRRGVWWWFGTVAALIHRRIRQGRRRCSAARRCWRKVFSPTSFFPLRSLRSCCWWRLWARWFWPSANPKFLWCR